MASWRAWDRADETGPEESQPAVLWALEHLHREPEHAVPELAARSGLGAGRLSRRFHEDMGASLTDYRNRLRLQRFLDDCDPDGPSDMLGCALGAGFGSYPQFHRVFRARMGCGPRDYFRSSW